jgi:hypothetical protein
MVWKETLNTYQEMIAAEGWSDKTEIEIPAVQALTCKVSSTSYYCLLFLHFKIFTSRSQLSLLIIGKCGFGFAFNWFSPPRSDNGRLSIQEALKIVSETNTSALLLPTWIKKLPIKR